MTLVTLIHLHEYWKSAVVITTFVKIYIKKGSCDHTMLGARDLTCGYNAVIALIQMIVLFMYHYNVQLISFTDSTWSNIC